MTAHLGYEQSADGGTHHRVLPYPYLSDYLLAPHAVGPPNGRPARPGVAHGRAV